MAFLIEYNQIEVDYLIELSSNSRGAIANHPVATKLIKMAPFYFEFDLKQTNKINMVE